MLEYLPLFVLNRINFIAFNTCEILILAVLESCFGFWCCYLNSFDIHRMKLKFIVKCRGMAPDLFWYVSKLAYSFPLINTNVIRKYRFPLRYAGEYVLQSIAYIDSKHTAHTQCVCFTDLLTVVYIQIEKHAINTILAIGIVLNRWNDIEYFAGNRSV